VGLVVPQRFHGAAKLRVFGIGGDHGARVSPRGGLAALGHLVHAHGNPGWRSSLEKSRVPRGRWAIMGRQPRADDRRRPENTGKRPFRPPRTSVPAAAGGWRGGAD